MEALMRNGSLVRRTFEVAIVEDSKQEAWLILESLKKDHRKLNVAVLPDGERASDHLQTLQHPFHVPDLILLDLSVPRKDAYALLAEIRTSLDLRNVPVVVLTQDPSIAEINRCYQLGANCVLVKPARLDSYIDALRAAEHYWLDVMGPIVSPLFEPLAEVVNG
jgi:CheY-like chemotaxis protein